MVKYVNYGMFYGQYVFGTSVSIIYRFDALVMRWMWHLHHRNRFVNSSSKQLKIVFMDNICMCLLCKNTKF